MVDGLHPGETREEIETGRLRRQLFSLQEDLERTRPLVQRVSERLGSEADRAGQSQSRPGPDRTGLDPTLISGSLLTAYTDGCYVDQELDRAQSGAIQASRGAGVIAQAAQERMRTHREPSRDSTPGPTMPR